jgi:hypothetical protein
MTTTSPCCKTGVCPIRPVNWVGWAPNIRNPEMVAPDGVAVTFRLSVQNYHTTLSVD